MFKYLVVGVALAVDELWQVRKVKVIQDNDGFDVKPIFSQHAASKYGFVRLLVSFVCLAKNLYATSKQGRRLSFGMLTVITNIRSTIVSW